MSAESQHTCPSCGNEFSGAMEFCPVCMLRKAIDGGDESFDPEDSVAPAAPEPTTQRFEHYELAMGEDGKPVELGRGAMGVTYKAFDKDLQCPVTLKIIGEKLVHAIIFTETDQHAHSQRRDGASGRSQQIRTSRQRNRHSREGIDKFCVWESMMTTQQKRALKENERQISRASPPRDRGDDSDGEEQIAKRALALRAPIFLLSDDS